MKRYVIIGITLLAVALAAAYAWRIARTEESASALLTLYGNVEIRTARLAFTESERVVSVEVEEGDPVVEGQVLARLRSAPLVSKRVELAAQRDAREQALQRLKSGARPEEIAKSEAETAVAEVRQRNAEQELKRAQLTADTGASSQQSLDLAAANARAAAAELKVRQAALALVKEGPRQEDIAEAEAHLAVAQAAIDSLDIRIADTELKAPSSGIIQSRLVEKGETVSPSRPAFTLALTDPKWIRAYVSEPDLGRVREGQSTTVLSDSWPDKTFTARIGFISPTAEFTPRSVETEDLRTSLVYEIRVWVEDPDSQLRLGMPVTIKLAN